MRPCACSSSARHSSSSRSSEGLSSPRNATSLRTSPTPEPWVTCSGATGHFVSESLPRRARSRPRKRALTCTLHGPRALCRERRENQPSRIPAARRHHRAPERRVGEVRNDYRVAPRSTMDTNRSLSRWGKRRTENRATRRPAFFERSGRFSMENVACSVSHGVHPYRAPEGLPSCRRRRRRRSLRGRGRALFMASDFGAIRRSNSRSACFERTASAQARTPSLCSSPPGMQRPRPRPEQARERLAD
jgi:hypothetical protein